MTGFRTLIVGSVLGLASAMPVSSLAAMPAAVVAGQSDIVDIRVICDFSGCYEAGPPPSVYDRPPPGYYRPPPPPDYYRPPPPPGGYYRPPPPPPPGYYRPPPPDVYDGPRLSRRHIDWCMDRYRSYNPRTNRYLARDGYFKVCRSPYY